MKKSSFVLNEYKMSILSILLVSIFAVGGMVWVQNIDYDSDAITGDAVSSSAIFSKKLSLEVLNENVKDKKTTKMIDVWVVPPEAGKNMDPKYIIPLYTNKEVGGILFNGKYTPDPYEPKGKNELLGYVATELLAKSAEKKELKQLLRAEPNPGFGSANQKRYVAFDKETITGRGFKIGPRGDTFRIVSAGYLSMKSGLSVALPSLQVVAPGSPAPVQATPAIPEIVISIGDAVIQ